MSGECGQTEEERRVRRGTMSKHTRRERPGVAQCWSTCLAWVNPGFSAMKSGGLEDNLIWELKYIKRTNLILLLIIEI